MANLIKMNLDTVRNNYDVIEMMQGYTYNFEFNIIENGKSVDLQGVTPRLDLLKGDDTYIIQTDDINTEKNVVVGKINKNFNLVQGEGKLQLILSKNEDFFGSWVIHCRTKQRAIEGNVGEGNIITILSELDDKIDMAINVKSETEKLIENGGAATKEDITKVNSELEQNKNKIEQVAEKGTTVEVVERTTKEEVDRQIKDGTITNLTISNHSIEEIKFKRKYGKIVSSNKMLIDFQRKIISTIGFVVKSESATYNVGTESLSFLTSGTRYIWLNQSNSKLDFGAESEIPNNSLLLAVFFGTDVNKLWNSQNIEVIDINGKSDTHDIKNGSLVDIKFDKRYARIVSGRKWLVLNFFTNEVIIKGDLPLKTDKGTFTLKPQTIPLIANGTRYLWFNTASNTLHLTPDGEISQYGYILAILFEKKVNKMWNNSSIEVVNLNGVSDNVLLESHDLFGKKILWLGTSIPAGVVNGKSYPQMLGEYFGANVLNESVGGSCMRWGQNTRVTSDDVYGIYGLDWQSVVYSLSATIQEKQYLIDNWSTVRNKLIGNPPSSLTDNIYQYSYERKILNNIDSDVFVFDHMYNDYFNGVDLDVEPTDNYNRSYGIGAMNYLIKQILDRKPRAVILIIGHFENQFRPQISKAQEIVSNKWSLPIYKQWEKLGWSSVLVNTSGYWQNGYWNENGGIPTTKKVKDIWLPDGVHPNQDKSGMAVKHIFNNMKKFLE